MAPSTWLVLAEIPLLESLSEHRNTIIGGGVIVLGVLVLIILVMKLSKGGKAGPNEPALAEDLSTYPPPPKAAGPRVTVMNQPGRLRLVVLAPVGKRALGEPEAVLDQVVHGLGDAAAADKARVRKWPPQLSSAGFAPTFFRLTTRPGVEGKPSRWVLLGGPARAGDRPILLGLAVLLDAPSKLGLVTLEELQWPDVLGVIEE
jgi:hypothetical protein